MPEPATTKSGDHPGPAPDFRPVFTPPAGTALDVAYVFKTEEKCSDVNLSDPLGDRPSIGACATWRSSWDRPRAASPALPPAFEWLCHWNPARLCPQALLTTLYR